MLLNPDARFELARQLSSPGGAPLGAAFSFVSGLYFRGKVAYAAEFGVAPPSQAAAHVITAGGGLCTLDERVTVARLRDWMNVAVHDDNPHFTVPLMRHCSELLDSSDTEARFVLLGSIASDKYVRPLLDILGERLLFPLEFAGRGDMSRGSLMLRAARERTELTYAPVLSAPRSAREQR
jgi:hypothetical protein